MSSCKCGLSCTDRIPDPCLRRFSKMFLFCLWRNENGHDSVLSGYSFVYEISIGYPNRTRPCVARNRKRDKKYRCLCFLSLLIWLLGNALAYPLCGSHSVGAYPKYKEKVSRLLNHVWFSRWLTLDADVKGHMGKNHGDILYLPRKPLLFPISLQKPPRTFRWQNQRSFAWMPPEKPGRWIP